MKNVLDWLVGAELMTTSTRNFIEDANAVTSSRFLDEFRNGIVLAKLACKLDPKDVK